LLTGLFTSVGVWAVVRGGVAASLCAGRAAGGNVAAGVAGRFGPRVGGAASGGVGRCGLAAGWFGGRGCPLGAGRLALVVIARPIQHIEGKRQM